MDIKDSKEIIKNFFEKMGCPATAEVFLEENILRVNLKAEEARLLIGQNGQTLADIQHLLAKIIKKKNPKEEVLLDLDIEDYKKRKTDYLKSMANAVADEVSSSKKEKIIPSLSSFDRRIVHMELSNRTDIKTESIGENSERKIIIKPL